MMIGILLSSLFRFFTSYTFDGRSNLQNLLLAKESSQHHYPMEMDHICYDKIRRRSPDKEQWWEISHENVRKMLDGAIKT